MSVSTISMDTTWKWWTQPNTLVSPSIKAGGGINILTLSPIKPIPPELLYNETFITAEEASKLRVIPL